MNKTFGTNKSILLGIVLWGIILTHFYRIGIPRILNLELIPMAIQLFIIALVGTIWFGIRYQISNAQLKIKLGPFTTYKVNPTDIESISRSYNPLSSPAPSLRRINLKLRYGGFVLLSPKQEKLFIGTLMELNPKINNNLNEESSGELSKFFLKLL